MTKKPDDWMPLDVRKYLGDTMHLSREQHGAYLLLIMAYWMRGGPLNDNDQELAAIVRASLPDWKRLRPVLEPFFLVQDGKWTQKKAEKELARARDLVASKSSAGKKGAQKRWHNDGTANGKQDGKAMAQPMAKPPNSQCQTDAPVPIPLPDSASAESSAAAEEFSSEINRLNKLLGFDERDFTKHAENARVLSELKAMGCDFQAHILPAAEQAARGGRANTLGYIRPRALELRDAARIVASLPVAFENADERGWRDRLRVWRDKQFWSPKWGPKPCEQGCKCPPEILREAA